MTSPCSWSLKRSFVISMIMSSLTLTPHVHMEHEWISDVTFLSQDHLVASVIPSGVRVSMDGGQSWTKSSTKLAFRELATSRGSVIWGWNPWQDVVGIDGLFYSTDGGGSWSGLSNGSAEIKPCSMLNQSDELPLLLDREGQVWEAPECGINNWKNWKRIGVANPDHQASGGGRVNGTIYVEHGKSIWSSSDRCETWSRESFDAELVSIMATTTECWACDHVGHLAKKLTSTSSWTKVADLSQYIGTTWSITVSSSVLAVGASITSDTEPASVIIDMHGTITPLPNPPGSQFFMSRVDPSGNAWAINGSLFALKNGKWIMKLTCD